MAKGFEKAGGKRVPTSSGVPQRTVYTGGRAATLGKPIYGQAQGRADTRPDIRHAGTREPHVLGKR